MSPFARLTRACRPARLAPLGLLAALAIAAGSPRTSSAQGNDANVRSSPPDLQEVSRPARPEDFIVARSAPGPQDTGPSALGPLAPDALSAVGPLVPDVLVDTVVNNTDPTLTATDTANDGETTIAVNPSNPSEIVISAFSGGWGTTAPLFHSLNGGLTWTKVNSVPVPPGWSSGCPCDWAWDFGRGNQLAGTILANSPTVPGGVDVVSVMSTNPALAAAFSYFDPPGLPVRAQQTNSLVPTSLGNADQPWLLSNRDPFNAAQDNVYVAWDDFANSDGVDGPDMRVAVSYGVFPPNFTVDRQVGNSTGGVNPGLRMADDSVRGVMWALFGRNVGAGAGGSKSMNYMLNRSTDGGMTWTLNGNPFGIVVAAADSTQPQAKFGTVNALLGGVHHAAVDPSTGDVYYAYGNRDAGTGNNRLAIRRISGAVGVAVGPEVFVTGQVQAALPSVAVTDDGTVAVFYYTFDGFSAGLPSFSTHLALSDDLGLTFTNQTLQSFLSVSADNGDPRQRVFGDYHQMKALGQTLFGAYTANGVGFGRPVANNDPIFFRVQVPVRAAPNLVISKSDSPDPVLAGGELVYTIEVTNDGDADALDVFVSDVLPAEVIYVDDSDACTLLPGAGPGGLDLLECELGDISAGETVSFQIKVRVRTDAIVDTGPHFIINSACVSIGDPSVNPDADCTTEETLVEDSADLKITKLSKPDDEVRAGAILSYTLYVDNLGISAARNVMIRDDILSDGKFVLVTVTACAEPSQTVPPNVGGACLDPNRDDTGPILLPSPAGGQTMEFYLNEPLEPQGADGAGRWVIQIFVRALTGANVNNIASVFTRDFCPEEEAILQAQSTGPAAALPSRPEQVSTVAADAAPRGMWSTLAGLITPSVHAADPLVRTEVAAVGALLGTVTLPGSSGSVGGDMMPDGTGGVLYVNTQAFVTNALGIYRPPVGGNGPAALVSTKTISNGPQVTTVAWDASRSVVWGAYNNAVYSIPIGDPFVSSAVIATFAFNPNVGGISTVDGLAYDEDRDTLWYSPDVHCCAYEFGLGGANALGLLLNTVTPKDANGNADGLVSGLVVGSTNTLYIGRNGAQQIRLIDKLTGNFISQFAQTIGRAEDLACDPVTYAPLEAIISKELTGIGQYEAFEAEPGTCPLVGLAEITCPGTPDPNMSNNMSMTAIKVIDTADVTLTKAAVGEEQQTNQAGLIFNNANFGQVFPTAPNYFSSIRVTAGRRIQYTLTVGNTGPSTAENVIVTDRLPAGVRMYQNFSGIVGQVGVVVTKDPAGAAPPVVLPAGTCVTGTPGEPLDKLTCGLGTFKVGDTATIVFQVITDASLVAGTVLENDAYASSDEFDPNNVNNYAFTHNTVLTAADMGISKSAVGEVVTSYNTTLREFIVTDTANSVTAGKVLRYQLQVQNNGPSDGLNVTIQENLPTTPVPGPVTFLYADGADCRPDDVNQQILFCDLGRMAAGARETIDIYVAVDAAVPAGVNVLSNTATVLQSGSSTVPPGPPPAIPGVDPTRPITWDPCVASPACTAAASANNANASTIQTSVTAVADVFIAYGPLPPPQPRQLAGSGAPDEAGAATELGLVDRVTASLAGLLGGDPSPDVAAAPAQQGSPLLAEAIAGTERRYVISFGNDGPSVARGVGITHLLDLKQAGLLGETFLRCEPVDPDDAVTCSFAALNTVTVTSYRKGNLLVIPTPGTGTLNPGDVFQYVLVTRIDPGYVLDGVDLVALNEANITTTTTDFHVENNRDRELTLIRAEADLAITKADDAAGFLFCDPVQRGGTITYDLTVTNNGPSDAADVYVVDQLPWQFVVADPALVNVTVSRGQVIEIRDDGQITIRVGNDVNNSNVAELGRVNALSAPVTIRITVTVRQDAACGQQAANAARVETRRNDAPRGLGGGWPPAPDFQPGLGGGPRTPTADPVVLNNAVVARTTVECPSVQVIKTVSFDGKCPGVTIRPGVFNQTARPVTFCFEVTNTGTTYLDDIFLTDTLTTRSAGATEIYSTTITSGADPNVPVKPGETVLHQVTVPHLLKDWSCGVADDVVTVTANPVNSGRTDLPCLDDVTDTDAARINVPCAGVDWRLQLPILANDSCVAAVEVQNVGDAETKALMVVWGTPGACPPQSAGPLKVECTGLIGPGSTWHFRADQMPVGANSAVLYSLSTDIVTDYLGQKLRFADLACLRISQKIIGNHEWWLRFDTAYRTQDKFFGEIEQSGAQFTLDFKLHQGEPLAAVVNRGCPDAGDPNVTSWAAYTSVSSDQEGARDPVYGGYTYYTPLLFANKGGLNSMVHIHNSGDECSSIEIWLRTQDVCLRNQIADVLNLAPGETVSFDPNTAVGPDWLGNAWISASQPLGIVVDTKGANHFTSYNGIPADVWSLDYSNGDQVSFAPLVYSEYQGWDSALQVQNLSAVHAAKVKVYFLDRGGDIITTLVDWICARGSQTYFLPVIGSLPGNWVGSARAESQEWISPGASNVLAVPISSVVTLEKWSDPARTTRREAIAYNGQSECLLYDWQLGHGAGGTQSGSAVFALPMVAKANRGVTTEIAITNLVPKPGFTDFAIFIYDQNHLIDYVCQKLNEKQVEYINLATWGWIDNGFYGSAVVSAVFWEHDVFDGRGVFERNLVGLGAVGIERIGGVLGGADVPGDESKGWEAFPIFDHFKAPVTPSCPGVPGGFGGR